MPKRLRPTAATAADAILVGDPGRALLLAQELLEQPKMSNHARGLWGYHGVTAAGRALTIQSTGIGGPSAALVLADLAELGVRRALRVGTCVGIDAETSLGELVVVAGAIAGGGSAAALGVAPGEVVLPDAGLTGRLESELGGSRATVASVDAHPDEVPPYPGVVAADMQTAPLLAQAKARGIEAAAILIVAERTVDSVVLDKEDLEEGEREAGRHAAAVLST